MPHRPHFSADRGSEHSYTSSRAASSTLSHPMQTLRQSRNVRSAIADSQAASGLPFRHGDFGFVFLPLHPKAFYHSPHKQHLPISDTPPPRREKTWLLLTGPMNSASLFWACPMNDIPLNDTPGGGAGLEGSGVSIYGGRQIRMLPSSPDFASQCFSNDLGKLLWGKGQGTTSTGQRRTPPHPPRGSVGSEAKLA